MKKIILVLTVIMACQTGVAQNVDALYNYFKDEKGVESVSVSPLLMKFARLFMDEDDKSNPLIKGVNSVKVLDLEECSEKVKERFTKEVAKLNLNGYETWLQAKEDGENVKIIAKMKELRQLSCEILVQACAELVFDDDEHVTCRWGCRRTR